MLLGVLAQGYDFILKVLTEVIQVHEPIASRVDLPEQSNEPNRAQGEGVLVASLWLYVWYIYFVLYLGQCQQLLLSSGIFLITR